MIRLSACIEMVFREMDFADRIRKSAQMGIPAIEFWSWLGKDLPAIRDLAAELNLAVSALCIATEDEKKRERLAAAGGYLGGQARAIFREMVEESIPVAKMFGSPVLIVTSGNALPGVSRESQRASLTECLLEAKPVLERDHITLVLEPLNPYVDHKGIYLARSDEAFAILRDVASPKVKLLYDIYHQQITEGNLIATITENIGSIGHFHTADVPGRGQPGTGEINYPNVLAAIAATDYPGYVGMEFRLTAPPEEALAHILGCAQRRALP